MRSIRLKLFILLVIMGSIPLMIVLVVDGVSTINELEAIIYQRRAVKAPCFSCGEEGGVLSFLDFYIFKCYTLNIGKTVVA